MDDEADETVARIWNHEGRDRDERDERDERYERYERDERDERDERYVGAYMLVVVPNAIKHGTAYQCGAWERTCS